MRISLSSKFILSTTLILLLVMGLTMVVISKRHEQLVQAQIEMQAKALFKQIVVTRRWIADHGGVFVEKLPWVNPNPYLPDSTIKDVRGRLYVKENPAMVTKQLPLYAEKEGLYFFHITSLNPVNPDNKPDEFESKALRDFGEGAATEASGVYTIGNASYFRYIAPLYVEKACLQCHARQGYAVGDVRGGMSVSLPMDHALAMLQNDRKYMILGGMSAVLLLMAVLYLMSRRMVIKPVNAIRSQMASFSESGDPHVTLIRSGDEIEDLSKSFADMARDINEYHTCLQEKIGAATRELTEKNEALTRASRSKSDFIAKTSHELRTPLTAIKGAMDYLSVRMSMRESAEDQELLVFFEMIRKNADRLIRIVNDVLEYERIELGAVEMNFREVNLKEVFQEVIAGVRPLADEKRVGLRLHAMDVSVPVDEDRIRQVLTNLLSNALNFSPEGSLVDVSLACRDEQVYASVEDRGTGIPEQDRDLIFKQFYTKDTKGGTGLGLAICKGIIEAHNGEIGVTDADGGGSRFWFRIPKVRVEKQEDEKKAACDR